MQCHTQILSTFGSLTAGKQGSIKLRRVDQYGNALTSSAGEAHFVCSSAGPEPLDTQVIEIGNGFVDIRHVPVFIVCLVCRITALVCAGELCSTWSCIQAATSLQPLPACLTAAVLQLDSRIRCRRCRAYSHRNQQQGMSPPGFAQRWSEMASLTDCRYSPRTAGRYQLTVTGGAAGDAVIGSPFTVAVAVRHYLLPVRTTCLYSCHKLLSSAS